MVLNQNGIFKRVDSFYPAFIKQSGFENYLFALWNEQFIFKDYLKQSFDTSSLVSIDYFSKIDYKNHTVKAAVTYLNAIANRYKNDFSKYYKLDNNLNAVKEWQYCGVFENLNKSGLDVKYPPEEKAISKTPFNANSNGFVNWYIPKKNKNSSYQFFSNEKEFGRGVNYAQTFITSESDQTVYINLGIGSAAKLWLNDVLIFEESESHVTELDAHTIKVTIPKGSNRLLIKLANNYSLYFIVRVLDNNGKEVKTLKYSDTYVSYTKSSKDELLVEILPNKFEEFFKNKIKEHPNNFFYEYCLINTYLRNSKEKEAKVIILKYLKKYPKSSLLRNKLMFCYTIEKDYESLKEVKKNMENDDENYYLVQFDKLINTKELFRKDVAEMKKDLIKISNSTDFNLIKLTTQLYILLRENDRVTLEKFVGKMIDEAEKIQSAKLLTTYSSLYRGYFKNDQKTIDILEKTIKDYWRYSAISKLISIYDKLDKKDKVIEKYKSLVNILSDDNSTILDFVRKLHSYQKYEASILYIDMALKNFPYSFVAMRLKGDALLQLNKKEEAIKLYKQSFSYDSGNSSLRKKIMDLEDEISPIEKVVLKNPYEYIKSNRNKGFDNNYGINILLDEFNMILYKEGGNKSRSIVIYEITTDKGVELLKEYNLNLGYGYNLIKSEIVKPDGSIVPAEKSGSNLVFNSLSIGDVIYIDYEGTNSGTGRFYKDFSDSFELNTFHTSFKIVYRVFVAKNLNFKIKVNNGELKYTKKKLSNYILHEWEQGFLEGLPVAESYMPVDVDLAKMIHLSTIESWDVIAKWYSDLVRSSIKYNNTVDDVFNNLFPHGFKSLSEEERAKKIYYYMMNNLTYSYVNFKQSGFIPQKPSKTIKSKLGDCKDFSTLFLALGRKADLDVNLVLISTSDNGQNSLVLPSTGFNHCIAKVMLDGETQYVELTNKFLPFKTIPTSLENALALDIPIDSESNTISELYTLKNVNQTKSVLKVAVELKVKDEEKEMKVTISSKGKTSSYYRSLLSEKNNEILKKEILDFFENIEELDLTLKSYTIDKNIKEDEETIFTSNLTINSKIQKLGKTKMFKLPIITRPYSKDIISLDKREYPIIYFNYENVENYITTYKVLLNEDQKFTEIPESQTLAYKKHQFKITYKLLKDNILEISIDAITDSETILPKDYDGYKTFVKSILEIMDTYIAYK
jgi:hypothetical protein